MIEYHRDQHASLEPWIKWLEDQKGIVLLEQKRLYQMQHLPQKWRQSVRKLREYRIELRRAEKERDYHLDEMDKWKHVRDVGWRPTRPRKKKGSPLTGPATTGTCRMDEEEAEVPDVVVVSDVRSAYIVPGGPPDGVRWRVGNEPSRVKPGVRYGCPNVGQGGVRDGVNCKVGDEPSQVKLGGRSGCPNRPSACLTPSPSFGKDLYGMENIFSNSVSVAEPTLAVSPPEWSRRVMALCYRPLGGV
ncbi:hypothetical protein QBC41DRAFT_308495 [Cercophora samala]|uniref:Uncharacterized protein n=1 Tax=Cercophora samala TaxID=330535 RepID=A0AA39YL69_9PEZI|nr:hypothetical protein QBC41DRAFT_308495 [Cercophora samala]